MIKFQKADVEWSIRVYDQWIIYNQHGLVTSSCDPHEIMYVQILQVEELRLEKYQISEPAYDVIFTFENETKLRIFPAQALSTKSFFGNNSWNFDKVDEFIIGVDYRGGITYSDLSSGNN